MDSVAFFAKFPAKGIPIPTDFNVKFPSRIPSHVLFVKDMQYMLKMSQQYRIAHRASYDKAMQQTTRVFI